MAVSRTWIKLYVGILDDPKLAELPDDLYRVFINLLAIGGRVDADGQLGTSHDIAFWLRSDTAKAEQDLADLQLIDITTCKKGVWSLKNWDKYQSKQAKPPSASKEAVRERVRKSREIKEKKAETVTSGNEHVTSLQKNGNDTREEKNREEEKREEKKKPLAAKPAAQRDELFDAIVKVCQADPNTAGASIGKVKSALLSSKPPYTPEEVLAFGEYWWSWTERKSPPSLWKLKEQIGSVRHNNNRPGGTLSAAAQLRAMGYTDPNGNPV